jgi:hypothetical protein
MDALIVIALLIIAATGLAIFTPWLYLESKYVKHRILRKERREIVNAIMAIRPLASAPDIRDTKREIVDAIIKRNLSDG